MRLAKGFSVREAFRINRISTAIAISTSKPTRSSLKPMFLVDFGMTLKDKGGRIDERPEDHRSFLSFILHPSSFLLVSAQEFLNIGIARVAERFIRTAENDFSVA